MLKKIFVAIVLFFASVQAEYEDSLLDNQFQELVYSMGMSLAEQDLIYDQISAQNALINVSQNVPALEKILQLFLAFDPEMVENNIDSIPSLINYEIEQHYDLAVAGIIWLGAFQDVFMIFSQLHPYDTSFEAWSHDMEYLDSWADTSQFEQDPDYVILWQACVEMIEAQNALSFEFKALDESQS